jgi:DNA-binding winged helix-turn-helix (wHTH) protein
MAQASALARAMTQLATARTFGEVAGVLDGTVAPRIDATWSALGVCAPDGVRMVAAANSGTPDTALPLDAELPVAAVSRNGRPLIHTSQAEIALKFPRLHARMVGARLQSLAHLPATAGGRTAAVLCFGWTDSTQAHRHRWLLTVLADLIGEAVARIGAPSAAAPDQRPERRKSDARGLQVGRVEVDIAARSVHIRGRLAPVVLGGREFAVLLQLLRSPGTVQQRRDLLERVWGPSRTDTSVVDVTMSRLRRKLDLREIVTVPNEGYLFDPDRGEAGEGRTRLSGSLLN